MAPVTRRWQCRVVVVRVALSAGHGGVRTGEWERRCAVVESRRTPPACCVAESAICRKPRIYVTRTVRPTEVCLVTGVARRRGRRVVVVCMALRAGNRRMHAGQRVIGVYRVIEFCIQPVRCGVARAAIVRQPKLRMRRVVAIGEIL